MSERTEDVEGLLERMEREAAGRYEVRAVLTEAAATIRALRSERDEARESARAATEAASALHGERRGLRAALSRKDAALREIRYQASEMKGAGSKGRTLAEIEDIADRALASEPGQEGGEDG